MRNVDNYEDEEDLDRGPSKSQRKRDCQALQDLGKELCELGPETLAKIELPEELAEAIAEWRRMRTHEARRRQLQHIGRVMRRFDGAAVREAIDRATGESKEAVAALHRSEHLRDALIADDRALTDFVGLFPSADVQSVRRLVRQARREAESGKPPKSSRELYKLIHALVLPPVEIGAAKGEDDDEA